ncbi:MAG: hypothetical protein M1830_001391 [Pleopsidium flavum]|nr:MAG: hypothetical protein M1830_001391 [Pleopsidium flavum]
MNNSRTLGSSAALTIAESKPGVLVANPETCLLAKAVSPAGTKNAALVVLQNSVMALIAGMSRITTKCWLCLIAGPFARRRTDVEFVYEAATSASDDGPNDQERDSVTESWDEAFGYNGEDEDVDD